MVVDVQESADRSAHYQLGRSRIGGRHVGRLAQVRPTATARIHIAQVQTGVLEIAPQGRRVPGARQGSQLLDLLRPAGRNCVADAGENDLGGLRVQTHVAARRQVGEPAFHLLGDVLAGPAEESSEAPIESEFLTVLADEVEHGANGLAFVTPETAPELLQEEGWTLRGPQHEQGVNTGDVDTFVEQVNGEDNSESAVRERAQCVAAFVGRRVA